MQSLSFIESTLGSDEKILVTAQAHWFRFFVPSVILTASFIFSALGVFFDSMDMLFIGLIIVSASVFLILGQMNVEIACTDRRVVYKRGVLWYRTQELRLNKIESVYVFQPIAPGLMGYGTIYFSGTGGMLLEFKYVKDPFVIKTAIEDVIDVETM